VIYFSIDLSVFYYETVSCDIDNTLGHGAGCIGSGEFTAWGDCLAGTEDVYEGEGESDNQREEPMA
jgi:hypothetical protein